MNQISESHIPIGGYDRLKQFFPVLIPIVLHLFLYFYIHPYSLGSDDVAYARWASGLLDTGADWSAYPFGHFASHRFTVILPSALIYKLFGIGLIQSTLWPLVCSLLTIVVLYTMMLHAFGLRSALFGALLLASNTLQIQYGLLMLTDIVFSCFVMITAILIYKARGNENPHRQKKYALAFTLTFYIAFLAKTALVAMVPFLVGLCIHDWVKNRNRQFWIWAVGSGLVVGALYLAIYYLFTGDPLYRLHRIEAVVGNPPGVRADALPWWVYKGRGWEDYYQRLVVFPIQFFTVYPGYSSLLALALGLIAVSTLQLKRFQSITRLGSFWAWLLVSLIGYFWFGSSSLEYYNPVMLVPRLVLLIIPPLCLLGGVTLATAWPSSTLRENLFAGVFLIVMTLFWLMEPVEALMTHNRFLILTGVLLSLLSLVIVAPPFKISTWHINALKRVSAVSIILFFGCYIATPFFYYHHDYLGIQDVQEELEIIHQHVPNLSEGDYLVTHRYSQGHIKIALGPLAVQRSGVRIFAWNDRTVANDTTKPRMVELLANIELNRGQAPWKDTPHPVRLFVLQNENLERLYMRDSGATSVPDYWKSPPTTWKLIVQNGKVRLYQVEI